VKTLKELMESGAEYEKNLAFVRKMHSKGTPNPMGHNYYFALKDGKGNDAIITFLLQPMNWGVVISEIIVAEDKGRMGFGTHVLQMITKEADKDGIELSLSAVPLAHAGKKIPKGKLIATYKKYGFKIDRGDHMIRKPK
jgi:GNAT superfamily N-acetyltransferase